VGVGGLELRVAHDITFILQLQHALVVGLEEVVIAVDHGMLAVEDAG